MMEPTKNTPLPVVLALAVNAGIVASFSLRHTRESAEARCGRIRDGMSPEEVAAVLADCTLQTGYYLEGFLAYDQRRESDVDPAAIEPREAENQWTGASSS